MAEIKNPLLEKKNCLRKANMLLQHLHRFENDVKNLDGDVVFQIRRNYILEDIENVNKMFGKIAESLKDEYIKALSDNNKM